MFDQSPILSITPGSLIDNRFKMIELIGSGAMGTVLLCKDSSLNDSNVVLKFLKSEYVADAKQFERFKNEALLMRELNHPNIVHVYDLCNLQNDLYYISMEYIEGSSVRDILDDQSGGAIPFLDTLNILRDVAIGMTYAHQKGIIHRDLKPDNVLVSSQGEVKLTDFGLGKTLVLEEDITDLGEAVGTPHYMSPEQLRGLKLDTRCDIYAFGIMAYELVTGEKPYQETNYLDLAAKHLNDPIPQISSKETKIPAWFNKFIAKCTAKNRNQRFQSFEEISEVLESFVDNGNIMGPNFAKHLGGRCKWSINWTLEKWKIKPLAKACVTLAMLAVFVVLLGKNNQQIRAAYAPMLIQLEDKLSIDLGDLKNFAFGKKLAEHATLNHDGLFDAIKANNEEAVAILIKAGIDLDMRNHSGHTPLIHAAANSTSKILRLIAQQQTVEQLNARDHQGKTAIIHAVVRENLILTQILLNAGASTDVSDKDLNTPLIHGVITKERRIIDALLNHGASKTIMANNLEGTNALKIAKKTKQKEVFSILNKISRPR